MKHIALFLVMLFTQVFPSFSQSYYFQQYSVGEGLPQSQVYALHQDKQGYLWLGTHGGGLSRFDGKNFINFTERDGLLGNNINCIIEDDSSHLWIGSQRGINQFDGQTFKSYQYIGSASVAINHLLFGPNGQLWMATDRGIYTLGKNNNIIKAKNSQLVIGKIYKLIIDQKKQIWAAGENGIFKLNNKSKWVIAWNENAEVLDLAENKKGEIWAAAFDYGLIKWDGEKWKRTISASLPSLSMQCLWVDNKNKLWVGTQRKGIFIYEEIINPKTQNTEVKITSLTKADGLCDNNIRIIKNDLWNNIWLGTSGGGACKYGGQEFTRMTTSDGLKSKKIYAIANDTAGGIWLSAGDQGVSYFYENNFKHFNYNNGFTNTKCRTIHRDLNENLWFGTEGAGIAVHLITTDSIPDEKFIFLNRDSGLASNNVKDIVSNNKNEIWIAMTRGGISKLTYSQLDSIQYSFKNFGYRQGMTDTDIQSLFFDKFGRLWFGTNSRGIGFIFKDQLNMLDASANLPRTSIRCFAENDQGYLWAGTEDNGIGRAKIYAENEPVFEFITTSDGLTSNNIYLLQFDEFGHLWAGNNQGVDKLTLDASGNILEIKHYGRNEGFKGVETCQQSSLLDEAGNLWFGTMGGLMRYFPIVDTGKIIKPAVHFTDIKLFYESLSNTEFKPYFTKNKTIKKGTVFPYDKNHLGFAFFAPNFPSPENITYSWQLIGSEDKWSPFSQRTEVSYSNLPPGEYTFKVRAKNEKNTIGDPTATSFIVEPPFWDTWWFRIAASSFILLLIGTVFWVRIKQVRKQAAHEKAQLELQNHLLQLEQKARQLQMNPHFIFNALNSIQSLVARKDFDASRSYILKFGKLMRAVLDNSRQALIPLDKEIDTLKKYLEMEQFCRDGKFDFKLNTDRLENDDLEMPPMLLQPFVENAILHGVAPLKNRKGKIEITFSENNNSLNVEIKDNGVGINKSPEVGKTEKKRSSAGIAVTRERIKILNGKLSIGNNEGDGTKVTLSIPL
ncbi:MAG: two-component regulator propeller domain-containing protein [Bacteroidota bacterium]